MMQKPWFKVFIWGLAVFFFYLASAVVISMFRPGPSENETMQFMMGMMSAMDKSMMGVAMNIEHDRTLTSLIVFSGTMFLPLLLTAIVAGLGIRFSQRRK